MREFQILIHPRLRLGRELRRKLAGRKHHLVIAIRQMVAIHIHVVELVVKPYGLGLLIGLKQRTFIPEPNVLNRVLIPCQNGGCQIRHRRIGRFLDAVQLVCFSRELDVVFQIGSFEAQLVRLHHELLKESGNQHDADDVQSHVDRRSYAPWLSIAAGRN